VFTSTQQSLDVDNLVLVTCRVSRDALFHQLEEAIENEVEGAPKTVKRIGDADAPAIIAQAVYAGHKYARELDCKKTPDERVKIDRVLMA
jgi:dimethylamine/trimethylamine dehydrogenase